jgi:nitroreductase/NAD-dependent dihydropyrimidine dehydrogenase PreA subunit
MIVVDRKKCRGCGLCARICHEQCVHLTDGSGEPVAQIDHTLCSTCTQCIALCPQRALSWDQVPVVPYDDRRLPAAEQLEELFRQRRTVRHFKQTKIGRALVREIVGYGVYAPTNNYELRAIVVDDPAIIEALDAIIMRLVARIYNLFYRSRIVFNLARAITPLVNLKSKVKMEHGLKRGRTYDAPPAAVVFVVGDRRILLSGASAQYALYNMILYAQAKGIGSRIKASGTISLDRSRPARKRLGLRRHEHILAALELGYPAVRFRNKVEGKAMTIEWVERRPDDQGCPDASPSRGLGEGGGTGYMAK